MFNIHFNSRVFKCFEEILHIPRQFIPLNPRCPTSCKKSLDFSSDLVPFDCREFIWYQLWQCLAPLRCDTQLTERRSTEMLHGTTKILINMMCVCVIIIFIISKVLASFEVSCWISRALGFGPSGPISKYFMDSMYNVHVDNASYIHIYIKNYKDI